MTLQQNIPLYNFFIALTVIFLAVLSFSAAFLGRINFISAFVLILTGGASFIIFDKLRLKILSSNKGVLEKHNEEINLLSENILAKNKALRFLPQLRRKTSFLFNVSQTLIELLDCEEIYDFLITTLGELFPEGDSVLLFSFNKEKDSLSLIRSLKRKHTVIKEKNGGPLDKWALHHNCSLLIEDLTKDFRFSYNQVEAYKERGAASFILSPLTVGRRLSGILRVENSQVSSFTLDDLRFLRNICDLSAVVIERVNLFARAEDLAIKDSLTSLYLRDYFLERLLEERKRSGAKKSPIGLIMLDIDDFKKINDDYGHVVGDFVLKKLAKNLTNIAAAPGNIICRFGGEEFIISFAECDKEELLRLGEEIRRRVEEEELIFRRKKINFTVSLGAILCRDDWESNEALIDRVDKSMYQAKRKGKNRLCFSE